MYKQILAQHNIWRLQEMLKSYLKAWEVLCTGLKDSKCSPHTLLSTHTEFPTPNWWVPKRQIFVQISTGEKQPWGFFSRCSVMSDTCSCWGALFLLPSPMELKLKSKCTGRSLLSTAIYLYQHKVLSTRNATDLLSWLQIHVTHQELLDTGGPSGHCKVL